MSAAKIASGVTFAIALAFEFSGVVLSGLASAFVLIGVFGLIGVTPSLWVAIAAAFIFFLRADSNARLHSRVRKLEKALAEKGGAK